MPRPFAPRRAHAAAAVIIAALLTLSPPASARQRHRSAAHGSVFKAIARGAASGAGDPRRGLAGTGRAIAAGAISVDPIALQPVEAAQAGSTIALRLDNRGTARAQFTLCVSPPLARQASCRDGRIGHAGETVRLPAPRPGQWAIRLQSGIVQTKLTVDVTPPGGKLTLLAAGDSEMQILDDDIAQQLSGDPVTVDADARQSTGLEGELNFDWQQEAAKDVAADHPDVTVIAMGANDGFAIDSGGTSAPCCGEAWSQLYAGQVAQMTRTLLQGSTGIVYWVLLPAPVPGRFTQVFTGVDEGIRLAASEFPGRVGLIDANQYFTPGNQYRGSMDVGGQSLVIHEADGVHLSADSDAVLSELIARRLRSDRVIPAG